MNSTGTHKSEIASFRFLPYWNPRQGMVFSVVLKDGFSDEASARQKIASLPAALASRASVISTLRKGYRFLYPVEDI